MVKRISERPTTKSFTRFLKKLVNLRQISAKMEKKTSPLLVLIDYTTFKYKIFRQVRTCKDNDELIKKSHILKWQ